jgi:hypothetical protein
MAPGPNRPPPGTGSAERLLPDEVATDRDAELEPVAGLQFVNQVRRHLSVLEPLDGEHHGAVFGCGRDRIASLRLVGRQPNGASFAVYIVE